MELSNSRKQQKEEGSKTGFFVAKVILADWKSP
jgi:hypothetical protein